MRSAAGWQDLALSVLLSPESLYILFSYLPPPPMRQASWIGHILTINCLLHDNIEGQMTEAKGVGKDHSSLMIRETQEDIGS